MKKAILAIAFAGYASTAMAAIAGLSHDLSVKTGVSTLSSCQYCHTPHKSNTSQADAPLWNRNNPTTSFSLYTAVNSPTVVLGDGSLRCLSCHDGSSDMGATYSGSHGFGGTNTTIAGFFGNTNANLTADLRDDHPVGVAYAGTGFAAVGTASAAGIKFFGASGAERVECASCHDPHALSDKLPGGPSFLRLDAKLICSTCHTK